MRRRRVYPYGTPKNPKRYILTRVLLYLKNALRIKRRRRRRRRRIRSQSIRETSDRYDRYILRGLYVYLLTTVIVVILI